MVAVGKTDKGIKRVKNEDGVFVANTPIGALPNLYIVADGMGGHQSGDVASKLAIEAFCAYIEAHPMTKVDEDSQLKMLLKQGVAHANYIVHREATKHEEYKGMGTTLTICTTKSDKLYAVHVGDSRIYTITPSGIEQLTTDHSYVQEMVDCGLLDVSEVKKHPKRNIITRAIGTYENIKVDTIIRKMLDTEFILLCSDGLTNMVDEQQIHSIIYATKKKELNDIVDSLIQEANRQGGKDNIAVVIGRRGEQTQ